MTAVVLKPHLLTEMYDLCFAELYRLHATIRAQKESLRKVLRTALSSKLALRRFLYFVNCNVMARFLCSEVQMCHERKHHCTTQYYPSLMNLFLKFVSKVAFCKIKLDSAGEDSFIKRLENMIYLREICLTHNHKLGIKVLQKMANIFAKLTVFDVDADTFFKLLEKSDLAFPKLEILKISPKFEAINKIVTTSERFPALEQLEIVAWAKFYETIDELTFAEMPFPTVKNLHITVHDDHGLGSIVQFDFEIVKNWLEKFPSLKKATVSIEKYMNYVSIYPGCEQHLHNAFKSINYGVDLDFTLKIDRYEAESIVYRWQYRSHFKD